jgi:hypothetical protein
MKRHARIVVMTTLVLGAFILSACVAAPPPASVPLPTPTPAAQRTKEADMDVIDQFFAAYRTYDMDKMLSLHTDDGLDLDRP